MTATLARAAHENTAQWHDTAQWEAWSTTVRVVVTDPAVLDRACAVVREQLAAVDAVASRFRDDAEVMRLGASQGQPQRISPLLARLVRAALDAAEQTDGDVDPTLGSQLRALGYDRDITELVPARGLAPAPRRPQIDPADFTVGTIGGHGRTTVTVDLARSSAVEARTPTWRDVVLDGDLLTVPAGVSLDLGATAKAFTADLCARRVAEQVLAGRPDAGVLVSLGGDIATAGTGPVGGWRILVSDGDDQPASNIALPSGAAVATSSTIRRTWVHDGGQAHHILDPATGRPAATVWRTVSVAAPTCLVANTLSTAAVVRGHAALLWLGNAGVSARFVAAAGAVLTTGSWPAPAPVGVTSTR